MVMQCSCRLLSKVFRYEGSEAFEGVILLPVHAGLHLSVEADRDLVLRQVLGYAGRAALFAVHRVAGALVVYAGAERILGCL